VSSPTAFQQQFPHLPRKEERAGASNTSVLITLALLGGSVLAIGLICVVAAVWFSLSRSAFVPEELWEEHLAWVIETSVLPRGEEAAVLKEVKRLADACGPEKITGDQHEEVLAALEESPVFLLLDVGGIERDVVSASGLSRTDKEQGKRTVRRAARGVHAGKTSVDEFYAALPPGLFYRTRLTVALTEEALDEFSAQFAAAALPASDDDVRAALNRLDELADKAGMPDENWKFDISDEFARAVSAALAKANH
jgi:hypothetical protein